MKAWQEVEKGLRYMPVVGLRERNDRLPLRRILRAQGLAQEPQQQRVEGVRGKICPIDGMARVGIVMRAFRRKCCCAVSLGGPSMGKTLHNWDERVRQMGREWLPSRQRGQMGIETGGAVLAASVRQRGERVLCALHMTRMLVERRATGDGKAPNVMVKMTCRCNRENVVAAGKRCKITLRNLATPKIPIGACGPFPPNIKSRAYHVFRAQIGLVQRYAHGSGCTQLGLPITSLNDRLRRSNKKIPQYLSHHSGPR
jgi:hypothetical protein